MLTWDRKMSFIRVVVLLLIVSNVYAEQTFQFKSPSFSGIGYSSHVQTIENTEFSRKKAIDDAKLQAAKDAAAAAANTNLQKFLNNFESRVYAQLSTQLVNNLFGENPQTDGTMTFQNQIITYHNDTSLNQITLTVTDTNTGNVTQIVVPSGTFKF